MLNYFLLSSYTADFFASLEGIRWVGGITISVALTFLLAQAGRFVGKELFEKIHFKDELYMPTTEFLLHSDTTYSPEHKDRLHSKILAEFAIQIHSPEQEDTDIMAARRTLVESVSMIRGKVKNGQLLLQHNIEYGFARNLIGGSLLALYVSIFNLYVFGFFFPNQLGFYLSLSVGMIYLLIVIIGRYLIGRYGVRYAKVLIQEYLLA
ncbi:MAG: hypothetical protein V4526_02450 [Patescibacteria group bacterium]